MSTDAASVIKAVSNTTYGLQWLKVFARNSMDDDDVLPTIDPHWFNFSPTGMVPNTIMAVFVAIVATVSTLGNALVILVFLWSEHLRKGGIYTVNLALSDFLSPVLSYYLFTATSFKQIWVYGKTVCVFYGFTQGFFGLMSIVTLAVISAERCYVILRPFKARDISTRHRLVIIVFIWIYCAVVAGPPVLGWSKYAPAGFLTSCCFDYLSRTWEARSFIIYLFNLGFTVPVIVIVFSYVQIFKVVYKSERGQKIAKHAGSSGQSLTHKKSVQKEKSLSSQKSVEFGEGGEKKKEKGFKKQVRKDIQMAKVMLMVIFTFVLAWTPYAVIALIGQLGSEGSLTPIGAMFPAIFAKTSTIYNPLIYAYKDSKFRASLRSMFPVFEDVLKIDKNEGSFSEGCTNTPKTLKSIRGKRLTKRAAQKTLVNL